MNSTRCTYPAEQVQQFCKVYILTGNFSKASREAQVDINTARHWKKQAWFDQICDLVRTDTQRELDSKFTGLIEESIEALEDRLRNGDFVLTKAGGQVRIPVRAAQVAQILSVLYEKRSLIRGEPTSRVEKITTEQRLRKLAKRFEELPKVAREGVSPEEEFQDEVQDGVLH